MGIFHDKPCSYWGTRILGKHQMFFMVGGLWIYASINLDHRKKEWISDIPFIIRPNRADWLPWITNYPLVIRSTAGKSTICRWSSHQKLHLQAIPQPSVDQFRSYLHVDNLAQIPPNLKMSCYLLSGDFGVMLMWFYIWIWSNYTSPKSDLKPFCRLRENKRSSVLTSSFLAAVISTTATNTPHPPHRNTLLSILVLFYCEYGSKMFNIYYYKSQILSNLKLKKLAMIAFLKYIKNFTWLRAGFRWS